jgi:HSP20 family molecular chaperone IbpA
VYTFADWFTFDRENYFFHRPMLENVGYYSLQRDDKLFILLNVAGVNPDDIKVKAEPGDGNDQVISIVGNTHNKIFDRNFDVQMKFAIHKQIKNIDWSVENGFMTLEVSFVETLPSVMITRK